MLETPFPTISEAIEQHADAEQHQIQSPRPTTAVATVDLLAVALSRFGSWRASAAALVERYRSVAFDLTTTKGYKELTTAISEVRAPRFAAQNVSRASKTELAGISKAIGAEEAAVAEFLADTETRLVKIRDDHDANVAAEKAEAKRLDDERIAGHLAKIATIKSFLARSQGLPSSRIALGIDQLAGQVYGDDWQEFRVPAENAQCETLDAMRTLHVHAVAAEAETKRYEDARAELEAEIVRLAAENARVAAALAERQIALDAKAAEVAASMARIKEYQQCIDEIKAAATGHDAALAAELAQAITAVADLNVTQYEEMAPLAAAAQAATIAVLCGLHDAAVTREAAVQSAALAPQPAPVALLPVAEVPEIDFEPSPLTLGAINEIFGYKIMFGATGLAEMGIRHSAINKTAKLYRKSDIGRICEALVTLAGEVREMK